MDWSNARGECPRAKPAETSRNRRKSWTVVWTVQTANADALREIVESVPVIGASKVARLVVPGGV